MKLLILGGTAWLGRRLATEALERGHDLTTTESPMSRKGRPRLRGSERRRLSSCGPGCSPRPGVRPGAAPLVVALRESRSRIRSMLSVVP
ncbi:hypothetical protein [Rathayibacter sp. VKM Ac-2803]|uniref:hypothetical protein n=1 Tax=Rathayibacter sp. VKM Ac-2803 TaxID=2609256 RepID=UPI001358EE20|nr:hypothetical protein [Rathayibacter sp. VKM Ac-2803]